MLLTILDFLGTKEEKLPLYNNDINFINKRICKFYYNEKKKAYLTYCPDAGELLLDGYGNCLNNKRVKTKIISDNKVLVEFN